MKLFKCLKNSKGVTLIEVVVVTAILGIAAELVAHNVVSQMPKYRIQGAARRIALDLMEARSRAINQSVDVIITFQGDARQYDVELDDDFDGIVDDQIVAQDIRNDFPGIVVAVTNNPFTFNPRGFSDTNSTITVSAQTTSGPVEKKIEVSLAGMVRVD
jgi:prepilin-type N-terminal cleavage/methylation domain-containing protein